MAVSHGIIDYTDQIYLPKALNLSSKKKYGFVFVDECQDLSKAQLYVVKQYLREDGRLLAVGDPYQAIYGFAGADCESFERVKKTYEEIYNRRVQRSFQRHRKGILQIYHTRGYGRAFPREDLSERDEQH